LNRIVVLGHGGVKGPEMNTIQAFRRALAEGAHGFEVDVHDTSDGKLAALHDGTFRANGKEYRVSELTLEQLRRLHPRGENIPSLGELLAQFSGVLVDVDAKTPRAARIAASLISREAHVDMAMISGDSYAVLREARRAEPRIRLGYSITSLRNLAALPAVAAALKLYSVQAPLDGIEVLGPRPYRVLLRAVRSRRLRIAVWSWKADEIVLLPVIEGLYDIVIADKPAEVLSLYRGRREAISSAAAWP